MNDGYKKHTKNDVTQGRIWPKQQHNKNKNQPNGKYTINSIHVIYYKNTIIKILSNKYSKELNPKLQSNNL